MSNCRNAWLTLLYNSGIIVSALVASAEIVSAQITQSVIFSDVKQLTTTGTADEVAISDSDLFDDVKIAFISNSSGNPNLYVMKVNVDNTVSPPKLSVGTINSITNTATAAHPMFSGDGSVLMFQSNQVSPPLDASVSNSDGSPETFGIDFEEATLPSVIIHQLTNYPSPTGLSPLPSPNPAGRASHASADSSMNSLIVFSSASNMPSAINPDGTPASNPEGNPEIFVYDRIDKRYYQLTNTASSVRNLHPVINASGSALAYVSNATGNYNVYVQGIQVVSNDPPMLIEPIDFLTAKPGQQFEFRATASDYNLTDKLTLTVDSATLPAGAIFQCDIDTDGQPGCDPTLVDSDGDGVPDELDVSGTFRWTQADFSAGDVTVEFTATDNFNDPVIFPITISPENQPPTLAVSGPTTVNENEQISLTVTATDPENDFVTLTAEKTGGGSLPSGATFKTNLDCDYENSDTDPICSLPDNEGVFSWKPNYGQRGSYDITFTGTDTGEPVGEASQPVTIVVNGVNRIPTISISPASQKVKVGKTATLKISASDADRDPITVSLTPLPGSTLNPNPCAGTGSASCTITWPTQTVGTYTVDATVTDSQGGSATATATIEVVTNQAPTITTKNTADAKEFECFTLTINSTDADGDTLSYGIDTNTMPDGSVWLGGTKTLHWHPGAYVTDGSFVPAGGKRVMPAVNFIVSDGTDTVTYPIVITVSDTPLDQAAFPGTGTVMTTVQAGASFSFTRTVQNSGFSTWTADKGYALVPNYVTAGMTAPDPVQFTAGEAISPGSFKTFTVNIQAPTKAGTYYINMQMSQAGQKFGSPSAYNILQITTTVPAPPASATLTASPTTVARGAALSVSWSASSGRPTNDWIGLYPIGATNTGYKWWKYTGGSTSGTLTLTAPTTAGTYEFRYLINGGYTDIARSGSITVQ